MAAETEAPQTPPAAELLERGRYALTRSADGTLFVDRIYPLCENCQTCGCGDHPERFEVPAMIVPFLTGEQKMTLAKATGMMRAMFGNGNGS